MNTEATTEKIKEMELMRLGQLKDFSVNNPILDIGVFPDNKRLATACFRQSSIDIWDFTDGTLKYSLEGHSGDVNSLVVTPTGENIVSGGSDGQILVWSSQNNEILHSLIQSSGEINCLAISQDGEILASGMENGDICIWDFLEGKLLHTLSENNSEIKALTFTPDDSRLISGNLGGELQVWDYKADRIEKTLLGHTDRINTIKVSPDNKWIISGGIDLFVRVWNIEEGQQVDAILIDEEEEDDFVWDLDIFPDGETIACATERGMVKLLEITNRKPVQVVSSGRSPVQALQISSNGAFLIAGRYSHLVTVWEISA